MKNPVYHSISEKFWTGKSEKEKDQLFRIFTVVVLIFAAALYNLVVHIFTKNELNCLLCDLAIVAVSALANIWVLRGKINYALNTAFSIPLFVYAVYLSDLTKHPALSDTLQMSVWWLTGGMFFLLLFSDTHLKIVFYYILSLFTLWVHLLKTHLPSDMYNINEPDAYQPLFLITLFFTGGFIIRYHFKNELEKLSKDWNSMHQGINSILHSSLFAIAVLKAERDDDGNVIRFWMEKINNAFESSFGVMLYQAQEQEADYFFNLIFRGDFELNKYTLYPTKKTREFYSKKLERWYKVHVLRPELNRFYIVFEDITKIKMKINELENSKKRYKVLLEAIPDIFFVIGKDGTYEDFVIKETDLFKLEDVNIIGNTIFNVGFPDNMANKINECIQSCLKHNTIETIEYALDTPNGTFLFEMRLAKLSAESVISVARDITKRKTAEFNLEKALKKAQESDRLKSAFLANLSHEIRTPLNIITNFTRMLSGSDTEIHNKSDWADIITQNSRQLLNMIDNTIHLSKIETGTLEVKMEFCQINILVRDVYNRYLPVIPDSKTVRLKLHTDVPNQEFGFVTDPRLLLGVLGLLVDNAIKYTFSGEITLGYEMIKNSEVIFVVSDTGIGIQEEEQENIFSRFYRIKNEINETTSGSGLGLPIAKHYIQKLGGELLLESVPGKGTKISFILPFREGKGYLRIVS